MLTICQNKPVGMTVEGKGVIGVLEETFITTKTEYSSRGPNIPCFDPGLAPRNFPLHVSRVRYPEHIENRERLVSKSFSFPDFER